MKCSKRCRNALNGVVVVMQPPFPSVQQKNTVCRSCACHSNAFGKQMALHALHARGHAPSLLKMPLPRNSVVISLKTVCGPKRKNQIAFLSDVVQTLPLHRTRTRTVGNPSSRHRVPSPFPSRNTCNTSTLLQTPLLSYEQRSSSQHREKCMLLPTHVVPSLG